LEVVHNFVNKCYDYSHRGSEGKVEARIAARTPPPTESEEKP
jgi:hypothetical protein